MKKFIALIAVVLAIVMALSLSACGSSGTTAANTGDPNAVGSGKLEETAGETITDVTGLKPEANVNPSTIDIGQAMSGAHTGDAWYASGIRGDNYIYFENADNSSIGLAYFKVEAGQVVKTVVCGMTDDNHLVDEEAAEGESGIDIVFLDDFKAYDYKNDTWYVRGDPKTIEQLFVGRQLADQSNPSNTLILKGDGTGVEKYDDTEYALTWTMTSASTLKFNDGEYDYMLDIIVDENNAFVSLSEQNHRIFIPEEMIGQQTEAQGEDTAPVQTAAQG